MEKWRLFDHVIRSVPEAEQTRTLYNCSKLLINKENPWLYLGIKWKLYIDKYDCYSSRLLLFCKVFLGESRPKCTSASLAVTSNRGVGKEVGETMLHYSAFVSSRSVQWNHNTVWFPEVECSQLAERSKDGISCKTDRHLCYLGSAQHRNSYCVSLSVSILRDIPCG